MSDDFISLMMKRESTFQASLYVGDNAAKAFAAAGALEKGCRIFVFKKGVLGEEWKWKRVVDVKDGQIITDG